jgi:hypothetical protein
LDDTARHRANVCSAMAPDVWLVASASKGYATPTVNTTSLCYTYFTYVNTDINTIKNVHYCRTMRKCKTLLIK